MRFLYFIIFISLDDFRFSEGGGILRDTSRRWRKLLEEGTWKIRRDPFWTYPHDFSEMVTAAPELYEELSSSKLVIFKVSEYRKEVVP